MASISWHSLPQYGISLVAETTNGYFISVNTIVSYGRAEETSEFADDEKKNSMPPTGIGEKIASLLLEEIE